MKKGVMFRSILSKCTALQYAYSTNHIRTKKILHTKKPLLAPPPGWPPNIVYITNSITNIERVPPSEYLKEEDIPLMRTHFVIKKVTKEHPAYSPHPDKGFGLFCTKFIPKDSILGEYTGETKFKNKLSTLRSPYELEINDREAVDALRAGNEMRMINDWRTIGQRNTIFDSTIVRGKERMIVVSVRDIHPNEEILCDYGPNYWYFSDDDMAAVKVSLGCLNDRQEQTMALHTLCRLYVRAKELLQESKAHKALIDFVKYQAMTDENKRLALELLRTMLDDDNYKMSDEEMYKIQNLLETTHVFV